MEEKKEMTEFLKAFVKVQKALKPAKKDSKNPHFKSTYADLTSCYEACKDVLSDNGFILIQTPLLDGLDVVLNSKLYHVSGQYIESVYYVCGKDLNPQVRGSALTYARRYSLITIVGLASEDDDGNAAAEAYKQPFIKAQPQKPASPGDYVIPFGTAKGQKLKTQTFHQLEQTLAWCKKNDKAPEYQAAILSHLDSMTQTNVPSTPQYSDDMPSFEDFEK